MAAGTLLLAVVALGLLAILVQAVRQNLALLRQVRGGERPPARLLLDAVLLWSPLALVIVAAVLSARWFTAASVQFAYRASPIDAFCRVEGAGGAVIPCTGMDGALPRDALRRAGTQAELEHLLSERFRAARARVLALSADALRTAAADRAAFFASLAPRHLLGLPRSPEDDPELVRLRQELRQLLDHPPPSARDPLDMLRFLAQRDAYVRALEAKTAQARARRRAVNDAAYADVPRDRLGKLWLAHRVAHALAPIPTAPDAATQAALDRLVARNGDAGDDYDIARRGLAILLARNEAQALDRLTRLAAEPRGPRTLELALALPRRCTVAGPDPALRRLAADFNAGGGLPAPGAAFTINGGTFPCFDAGPAPTLVPLGFKASVRRSIDRWHAQALADSARRLGRLAGGSASTRDAASDLADAIPRGIDLGRAECGLLHPLGCGANLVRQAAEESLADAFAEVADPAARGATTVAGAAEDVHARVGATLVTLDARLGRMRTAAHAQAQRLFLAGDLLRLLGWLALALVVLKSFLYVLALEVFHHEGELTFGLDADNTVEGEVHAARQVTIAREFTRPLITRKQLSNSDNDLRIAPWPGSAPLARILRGRYFLYTRGTFLADADRPAHGRVASASGGMAIVEWRMRPGEEVVFGYRDFFGASDNVRLRSVISLRLSTLLLGRIVFRIARCEGDEGRLLLRAHVEELDPQHIRAIPPERLLAWHRHARFGIHSGRTAWKTLLNGYTLVRKPGMDGADGQVVVSSEDVGSNLGSIRFVRRIFSALF
jgi:hypothetical protein